MLWSKSKLFSESSLPDSGLQGDAWFASCPPSQRPLMPLFPYAHHLRLTWPSETFPIPELSPLSSSFCLKLSFLRSYMTGMFHTLFLGLHITPTANHPLSLLPPPVLNFLSVVHCFTTLVKICYDFRVLFSSSLAPHPRDAQLYQDKNYVCFVRCGMCVLIVLLGSCFLLLGPRHSEFLRL